MDDEYYMLSSTKELLEKAGYRVSCFDTSQKALDALKHKKFDLLILDIMMPDISGWEVFSRVKLANSKQKIIFVSVLDLTPERKKELDDYGLAEYITKPFDRAVLIDRVKTMLNDDNKET
jgi:DNA-binding response OmpR family regulator